MNQHYNLKNRISRCAAMLALLFSVAQANAYDFIAGNVAFDIKSQEEKTVEVARNNYSGSYEVPEKVVNPADGTEYTVVGVGFAAFAECYSFSGITLPSTVTYISNSAFYACIGMYEFTVPDAVRSIGIEAFIGCLNLGALDLPSQLESIGSNAFTGCSNMTAINVADDNPYFSSIDGVLYDKSCTTLLRCPEGKMGDFTVPVGVTEIASKAFYACQKLTGITLHEGITTINNEAFYACSLISSMSIPESITTLGSNVFGSCASLASVDLPASMTSIDFGMFGSCWRLQEVNIAEGNPNYSSYDGIVYNPERTKSRWCPRGRIGTVTVPEGVTIIGGSTFTDCTRMYDVVLPTTLKTIEGGAFARCYYINNVVMPEGLESIGSRAFSYCSAFTAIAVPEGVVTIGDNAFEYCTAMKTVDLPSTLTSLGNNVFNVCGSLEAINVAEGNTVYASNDGVLYDASLTTLLSCPKAKTGVIEVPEGVKTIAAYGLAQIENASAVVLPISLSKLGDHALYGTLAITSITIPAAVTSIGGSAFSNCYGINKICSYVATPPHVDGNTFNNIPTWAATVYVPASYVEAYQNAAVWQSYNIAALPEMGDMNGDGNIDISDMNTSINIVCGTYVSPDGTRPYAGDINADGTIDIIDINAQINATLER